LTSWKNKLPPSGTTGRQPLQRRALQRAAAVPTIVVAVVKREPSFMALAVDVGRAGLALGVEAVEGQLKALLARLTAVDCAANLALDLRAAHGPLGSTPTQTSGSTSSLAG
jgi:hypothetical protein